MTKTQIRMSYLLNLARFLCITEIYNIQTLLTELYKIEKGLSLEIVTKIFARETEPRYNLR